MLHLAEKRVPVLRLDLQQIPRTELVLQVLRGPETSQLSLDEDPDLAADGVRLLHGVSGEDGAPARPEAGADGVPDEPLGLRIHPRAGLVQEDNLGVAHHGYPVVELPLSSPTAVPAGLASVLLYVEAPQVVADEAVNVPLRDSSDPGEEPKVFPG